MAEETAPAEDVPDTPQDTPEETAEESRAASGAWSDVLEQLDALGDAIGRWTMAAVNDPSNRERATELKEHVERIAQKAGDAIDGASESATKSEVGQAFKEAASKTGEAFKVAGTRFTDEVAPRVASAFRSAADGLHQAAERMEGPPDPAAPTESTTAADSKPPAEPAAAPETPTEPSTPRGTDEYTPTAE